MTPPEIFEKIKKLLRLARSSNPHEAQLAMEAAMRLAAEHRVELNRINPDAQRPTITHQDTGILRRLNYDRNLAGLIVERFFRVTAIGRTTIRMVNGWPTEGQTLSFVGTASDIEIALYVYHFLVKHFAFCWRRYRGRLRNRYSFVHGMYMGLYSKLVEAEPPAPERSARGDELAISVDGYLAAHFGKLEQRGIASPTASAASWAGYVQGRQTEIRSAIKCAAQQPLALTATA